MPVRQASIAACGIIISPQDRHKSTGTRTRTYSPDLGYFGQTLSDHPQRPERPRFWTQNDSGAQWRRDDASSMRRFLGGSPLAVLLKLIVVSVVVGALLMWLRISPADVFAELTNLADQLWSLGFRSLHDFGTYLVAGAAIVVPVWLILRVLSFRGR